VEGWLYHTQMLMEDTRGFKSTVGLVGRYRRMTRTERQSRSTRQRLDWRKMNFVSVFCEDKCYTRYLR
jgi:hypothetical protein